MWFDSPNQRDRWQPTQCRLGLGLVLVFFAAGLIHAEPTDSDSARICRVVAETIPKVHYSARPIDETMARRILPSYVDLLDAQHMIFLQSDLEEFSRKYEITSDQIGEDSSLAEKVKSGDMTLPREIAARYRQRFTERMAYVEFLLKQTPDFAADESWRTNRRKACWPQSVAEANELWRLRIKFELLEKTLSGKTLEEGVKALSSDYSERIKSIRLDDRSLLKNYLTALARAYDPHSAYYPELGRASGILHEVTMARNDGALASYQVTARVVQNPSGGDRYGVVKLPVFYQGSAQAVTESLALLAGERPAGLVLDLRGNQGGMIDEALDVLGLFINRGPAVRFRERGGKVVTLSTTGDSVCMLPLVVLVDGVTASAAEIVAGALQDYKRAVVVGSASTFGKGTMQGVIPLSRLGTGFASDPGELKLTIRQFYRITGAPVQGCGVASDVVLPLPAAPRMERDLMNVIAPDSVSRTAFVSVEKKAVSVESLRERSALRVQQNRAFDYISRLSGSSSERAGEGAVSLCYEKRRAEMLSVQELKSALENLPQEWRYEVVNADNRATVAAKRDCILDESVSILRDVVELSPGSKNLFAAQETP